MFIIGELINGNETIIMLIYCLVMLWLNVDYLREYKKIKEGMMDISSEEELEIDPKHISVMLLGLLVNFIRRWFIYLLAVSVTENAVVIGISIILFVASLYDTLFNYSLAKMKKSKTKLYLAMADAVFISIFIIHLFTLL